MTWVAPKSWPSNSSLKGTSSSPMKQAARMANACSESSIFMASLVVTGSPAIERAIVDMAIPSSVRATLDVRHVRVGCPPRSGLFQDALLVEAVFRPIDNHRIGFEANLILARRQLAVDRVVLVIGEFEDAVVDPAEAFLFHHRHVPLLQVHIGLSVALALGVALGPSIDLVMDTEPAVALQHHAALELAERLEPAQPHGARRLAVDIHDDVRCGIVVAVELFPIGAGLLAHEHGSPKGKALHQFVGTRRELDGDDGTRQPRWVLQRRHFPNPPRSILRCRSGSGG